MKHLFPINGEGGPLLSCDAETATQWHGASDDSNDYYDLCAAIDAQDQFSAAVMATRGGPAVVWEMWGAGTADVFMGSDGSLTILRGWLHDSSPQRIAELARREPSTRKTIGTIDITSGVLAILWAPESGSDVPTHLDRLFQEVPGTSFRSSAFALNMPRGSMLATTNRSRSTMKPRGV